ncbi:prolyl oligopeptidase family serine peptidase [Xanthomonas campestris pv. raphani]|uniref:S9 family peptidase n=1 Tax=Xanthomonas campestris TaxID=339 RepID=UPI002365DE6F|nr:prolyl oligopeptidase family serine peptidase [Xanthomonas campestris]MEB2182921.1 prolyl oligopeptidase family serine peptidase [Xanthomonas campestris pv. campestris]MEA9713054.1 prolyl oligopeptidase family serine peptidase [Xanthomonas campestris]MEA9783427.1 prolyl oligopeptidase family serine peptidase [Xanthomonas campestris pv. raphani]MEA9791284.1 prolyl oligopeptidase family serine peptidase [Xanthomonas campestris pv. raphani]MEA9802414.1 prolyl oligopeptidase family serine pepti
MQARRTRRQGWQRGWVVLGWLALSVPALAQPAAPPTSLPTTGYQLPSKALQAVVDAPRAPLLQLSPRRDLAAMLQLPALPDIAEVAQPELKLAGVRIHPKTHAASRFSFASKLWLLSVADGSERQIAGLPAPLSLADLAWSPDQRSLAFRREDAASGANELWVVDVAAGQARRLLADVNTSINDELHWLPDSSGLLVQQQLRDQTAPPARDAVPAGPAIQQTSADAGVRAIRTYQDLLRNEADARLFEYYATAQPVIVGVNGQVRPIAAPGIYLHLSVSPDGRYVLSERSERPFSYLAPLDAFARRIEVLDLQGKLVRQVAQLPLVEGLPTGNDAVPTGVREIAWRADAPATLVWAEAQDGGDPARTSAVRDAVLMQAAPFKRAPVTLAKLGSRFEGVQWGRGDLAIISESWWKTRRTKQWRIAPDQPQRAPELLWDRSSQDRYNDPGTPALITDDNGHALLQTGADGNSLFLLGKGASPEGDRPFVDRFDLQSKRTTRLFHSQAPTYAVPIALLDAQGTQLLLSRESPEEPANYYLQTLGDTAATPRALTRFAHPLPQLRGVQKEQIRYKRNDGVDLTATLLLPPGYDPKRDGPRPLLMWAYPGEFKSADTASQVTDSPYRFNAISYWGPQAFLAIGYVVLNNPAMPIVGEGDAEPNDTYLPQLIADAQAAVDEVVRRGVTDREHIAIGGHSYGAFMTANLLAHTRLFKAGIARSGAYNRSLTPFGFQAEERNYWQAQPVYQAMSPFNYADKIKDPLLLIHGQDDNNSGTFPIQSERLFTAIKGLGGNARLVMLPNEAHAYRARQSILHMLAESEQWLKMTLGEANAPATARKR